MDKCIEDKRDEIDLNSRECGYMTRKQRVRRTKFRKSEFVTSATYENYRAYLTASGKIHLEPLSPAHEVAAIMKGGSKEEVIESFIVDSRPCDPLYRVKWRGYPGIRWESYIGNTTCLCINTAFWRALQAYTSVGGNTHVRNNSLASRIADGVFNQEIVFAWDSVVTYWDISSTNYAFNYRVSPPIVAWFKAVNKFGPFVEVNGSGPYMPMFYDQSSDTVVVGAKAPCYSPGNWVCKSVSVAATSRYRAKLYTSEVQARSVSQWPPDSRSINRYRSFMDLVRPKNNSSE